MDVTTILTIDDPALRKPAQPVQWPDAELATDVHRLGSTLENFHRQHGFGRAISAPQVGISKRIIYVNLGPPLSW